MTDLVDVPSPDLRDLLRALEQRRSGEVTESSLLADGLGPHALQVAALVGGLDSKTAAMLVRAVLAERERRTPSLDLVWTGSSAKSAVARDTSIVVRQLFSEAKEHVIVAGFRFDDGETIFRPLHEAMLARRVEAQIFLDIEGNAASPADEQRFAESAVDRFFAENWPFGPPRPEVYFDPRTVRKGPPWVSLHAKCIVVDGRKTFITSANFTDRGQTRNIELGVLIEDSVFSGQVVGQWKGLIAAGLVTSSR